MKFLRRIGNWFLRISNRYEAATYSQGRPYIPASVQDARYDANSGSRSEILRKARYFQRNNPIVNKACDLFECYTVGTGLVCQPTSSDEEWNVEAKRAFDAWSLSPDISSLHPLSVLLSLSARSWLIDGDGFWVLTRDATGRPRVQMIEGHRCGTPPELAKEENKTICDGVVIDPRGRPVGYWFKDGDKWQLIPQANVVHVYEPDRVGMYRGISFLSCAMNQVDDLDALQTLEMKAARAAAVVANVVKTATGELDSDEILRQGYANASPDGSAATYYKSTPGGETIVLRTGDEMQQYRSDRPSVVTREYWKKLEELVCTGIGIPHVLVFPDSMQGTVFRGALDVANAFFRARSLILADALRRIYLYWLSFERVTNPLLQDLPGDWQNVMIHPPRAVNVDVGYQAQASIAEIAAGTSNLAIHYGARGMDWREGITQKAVEAAFIRDLAKSYRVDVSEISTTQQDKPDRIETESTTIEETDEQKVV